MEQTDLTRAEIEVLLERQRIVRVCFSRAEEQYLLPVGYVWSDGTLNLLLSAGKKTAMALANPRVAFQVDDAAERGMLDWCSVTGEGDVEIIENAVEQQRIAIALIARFPELAQWGQKESQRKEGAMVFARIRPAWMTGRRFKPALSS